MTSQDSAVHGISASDLAEVSRTRVFFGHQSVGMNVLDGVAGIYAAHGMAVPPIAAGGSQSGADGGFIDHAFIGENADPLLKIDDFDARLRGGAGPRVDVAMMKLCYIDITADTNINALLARYRAVLGALERDFPAITFVHVTVPLMTDPRPLSKLKSRLTGNTRFGAAENTARERLNAAIRREYSGAHLFDLAATESTAPDGHRASGAYRGERYFHLYPGYASDSGHLNDDGAQAAATAWLHAVARAAAE